MVVRRRRSVRTKDKPVGPGLSALVSYRLARWNPRRRAAVGIRRLSQETEHVEEPHADRSKDRGYQSAYCDPWRHRGHRAGAGSFFILAKLRDGANNTDRKPSRYAEG